MKVIPKEKLRRLVRYSKKVNANVFMIPLPESDVELALISFMIFGVELHLKSLRVWSYDCLENHDDYYDSKRNSACGVNGGSYEIDHLFWDTVFGKLKCGGIAGTCYGQFTPPSYRRSLRLKKWILDRQMGRSNYLRPEFVRLARQLWDGREQIPA